MRAFIVTPARPGLVHGNRVTAGRYRDILRELGHMAEIAGDYTGQRCDLLIALHARKSSESVARYRHRNPTAPLIVVLTGTDLYEDLPDSEPALRSLEAADRIVALQPLAVQQLPAKFIAKLRPIIQSAVPVWNPPEPLKSVWEVCVSCHLRQVKDPLRAAEASRLLPADSRIRVTHVGRALTDEYEQSARSEMARNPKFRWLGARPQGESLRVLARSRLMVQSSILEGGANVVSEALANHVPIICSRIPGNLGILGEDYPGAFEPGNTDELATLMYRAEKDVSFYGSLKERCRELASLAAPEREAAAWKSLLTELGL